MKCIGETEYIVADAGYGSESNYECVADKYDRQALIPYNTYHKEQKKRYKADEMHPNHRWLPFKSHTTRTDKYGYQGVFKIYECEDCQDCPLMALCKTSAPNKLKRIQKNMNLEYFKAQVNQALSSPEGRRRCGQRKIDVETTFGKLRKLVRQSVLALLKPARNGLEILSSRFPSRFSYFFKAFVPAPFLN